MKPLNLKKSTLAIALTAMIGATSSVPAHDWGLQGARPDGHAPIGVMGEHTHHAGKWMVSYRYMNMFMSGNRSGETDLSVAQVGPAGAGFIVVPTEMSMEMHMLGIMYAPVDRVTVMLGLPFKRISMDHIAPGPGIAFTTESAGISDLKLGTLTRLWSKEGHGVHLNLGLSVPTGSIDETDFTPAGGPNSPLPYPMQLGSGTVDFRPGITYNGQSENWSWGAQTTGAIRLGENGNDYTLGNELNATAWGARRLNRWASLSFRLNSTTWGNIDGADSRPGFPAAGLVPTADPNRRGGSRLDALFGVNLFAPKTTKLKGHRLAIEGGLPISQHLEGPQLETDWIITAGWQFSW